MHGRAERGRITVRGPARRGNLPPQVHAPHGRAGRPAAGPRLSLHLLRRAAAPGRY